MVGGERGSRGSPALGARGYTLLEVLIACLLTAAVLGPALGMLANARRNAEAVARRAEGNRTARGVFLTLGEELRRGGGLGDHADLQSSRVLELRAFRGFGLPCTPVGGPSALPGKPDELAITYIGTRLPDATKDSVETVLIDGSPWRTGLLDSSPRIDCSNAGGKGLTIRFLEVPPTRPVLVRIFERGEYHLASAALRYRRGAGGRQPLTPSRIAAGGFTRADSASGALGVWIEIDPDLPGNRVRQAAWVLSGRL